MVMLKRKAGNETERGYEGYDSVIELDDRKSYTASQKEIEVPDYSTKETLAKPREEVMPRIKKETKPVSAPAKEAVSAKAKVLLAAYIIIAVVLAAVVIGTGVALTEIGNRNIATMGQIEAINTQIDGQNGLLVKYSDPDFLAGEAVNNYKMGPAGEIVEVTLVSEVSAPVYVETENWFGKLCDFFSRLFN